MEHATPSGFFGKSRTLHRALTLPSGFTFSLPLAGLLYFLVYVAFNYSELYWNGLYLLDAGQESHAAENLALFFLFSACLILALLFAGAKPFVAILLACCLSFVCDQTYRRVSGSGLNVDSLGWLIEERHRFSDFVVAYYRTIIRSLIISGAFAASVYAIKANTRPRSNNRLSLLALLLLVALQTSVLVSGKFVRYAPGAFEKLPPLALLHLFLQTEIAHAEVTLPVVAPARFRKIVVVIDESISHEVFAANQGQLIDRQFHLHRSLSPSNCSAGANSLIRWGARPDRVAAGADPRGNPPLWKYARAAHFETYFIDAQTPHKRLQNNMSEQEFRMLDHALFLGDGIDSDWKVADRIVDILGRKQPALVFAVLRGAHFPYLDFPDADVSTLPPRERHARSFLHSKSRFFEKILPALGRDTLFIYTSDHGQVFGRDAAAHCNVEDYSPAEYEVPLLVFPESELALAAGPRTFSNYQIFPSVLRAMGYADTDIAPRHGDGLRRTACEHRIFQQVVFNSLLGTPPPSELLRINACAPTGK